MLPSDLIRIRQMLHTMEPAEQIAYLVGRGCAQQDAEDFVASIQVEKAKVMERKTKVGGAKWSDSPQFKSIRERISKLQEDKKTNALPQSQLRESEPAKE